MISKQYSRFFVMLCAAGAVLLPSAPSFAQVDELTEKNIQSFYQLYMHNKDAGSSAVLEFLDRHFADDVQTYIEVTPIKNDMQNDVIKLNRGKDEYISGVQSNVDTMRFYNSTAEVKSILPQENANEFVVRVSFTSDFTVTKNAQKGQEDVFCRDVIDVGGEYIKIKETSCYSTVYLD